MQNTSLTSLSDGDLIAAVDRLAAGERDATASVVAHLAELYGRRLHERAGYCSLFTYCLSVLRLSESAAYDRMKAAKVARRYPTVLELLASGRLNLTAVRLLTPHLTRDNHAELFAAACGKRKRQVQEMLARRFPRPDVPSSVRKLPAVASEAVLLPSMPVPSMTALPAAGAATAVPPKFHHVVPRAAGGLATLGNLSLRCRAHNGCEVELFFGPGKRYLAEVNGEVATSDAVTLRGHVSSDASRSSTRSRTVADRTSPSAALSADR
jgi:hypothetical protein